MYPSVSHYAYNVAISKVWLNKGAIEGQKELLGYEISSSLNVSCRLEQI